MYGFFTAFVNDETNNKPMYFTMLQCSMDTCKGVLCGRV
jgi:hypothetical protein